MNDLWPDTESDTTEENHPLQDLDLGDLEEPVQPNKEEQQLAEKNALEAALIGEKQGFKSREASPYRKPGPKQTEPQDRVTIPGAKRVVAAFKNYAHDDEPLWHALERLLNNSGIDTSNK